MTPLLRAVSLPGAQAVLAASQLPPLRWQIGWALDALRLVGADLGRDAADLLRLVDALPDATSRAAFIRTLRAVVDWRGQVVTMLDRCYLTRGMPTMLVWGARDAVVPLAHAHTAHAAMPGSRLEVFNDAGHFPHHSDPARFVGVLEEFLDSTDPARWSPEQWRQLLRCPPARRCRGAAGSGVGDLTRAGLRGRRRASCRRSRGRRRAPSRPGAPGAGRSRSG